VFSRANWHEPSAPAHHRRGGGADPPGRVGRRHPDHRRDAAEPAAAADRVRRDPPAEAAGIKPERAQVLPGGIAVLGAVFETLGITELTPARGGLRLGLLYDLLGRRERHDLRDATVARLQKRSTSIARRRSRSAASPASCTTRSIRRPARKRSSGWPGRRRCTRSASRSRTTTITSTVPTWSARRPGRFSTSDRSASPP